MVILSDLEKITFDMIKDAALVLVVLYALQKVISEIIIKIGKKTQKDKKIEDFDPDKIKKDLIDQYLEDQKKKWHSYDVKIVEIEGKIDDIKSDSITRNQEVMAELYVQTDCMEAIFQGFDQLHCNGPVTEAAKRLHNHIKHRAYPADGEEE